MSYLSYLTSHAPIARLERLRRSRKRNIRNATIVVCSLNITVAVYLLLHAYFSSSSLPLRSSSYSSFYATFGSNKRVRDIQHEVYTEPKMTQPKLTAVLDLSKRLKDFRSANDAASLKAIEEWRKRIMD